ncbi:MAG TPA: ComEC/Rec2 family competence protein, partial [Pseudoxanthomonas sp.]|nr:ComEC/Rec2 family competence protein [Pseudoxanthomonas sp.]
MRPQRGAGPPALGIAAAAAALAGAGSGLLLPWVLPWWVLAPAAILGFSGWWRGGRLRLPGALLLGLAWAGLHAAWVLGAQLPPSMEQGTARVSGRIADLPQAEPRRTRFRLRVDDDPRQPEALRGKLLQLSWYDDFGTTVPGPRTRLQAGARWRLDVKLRAPRGLANPGGFDSERYALAQRIAASGYVRNPAGAVRLAPPTGVNAWRERMSKRIGQQAGAQSSRFIRALALGDTQALEQRDWETLRAVGLTHLIAISGFHVGLVAGFVSLLCAGTWRLFPRLGRLLPRPQAAA